MYTMLVSPLHRYDFSRSHIPGDSISQYVILVDITIRNFCCVAPLGLPRKDIPDAVGLTPGAFTYVNCAIREIVHNQHTETKPQSQPHASMLSITHMSLGSPKFTCSSGMALVTAKNDCGSISVFGALNRRQDPGVVTYIERSVSRLGMDRLVMGERAMACCALWGHWGGPGGCQCRRAKPALLVSRLPWDHS